MWDSGVLVRAEAGDTAASVARQFSVPTWAIGQLNQLMPGEPVEPGRALVVPRMIAAPADVSLAPAPVLTRRGSQ